MLKKIMTGLILAMTLSSPTMAGDVTVTNVVAHIDEDANGRHLEIFMDIANAGAAQDQLYAARSKAAGKIALATVKDASGDSHGHGSGTHATSTTFTVPAGGNLSLKDGGKHLMAMKPGDSLKPGSTFTITLFFEKAGMVTATVTIEQHG